MDAKAAMRLSNVTFTDKLLEGRRKSDLTSIDVGTPLNEIMWKVVTENPTWEFRVDRHSNDVSRDDGKNVTGIKVNRFEVYKDNERIGTIGRKYRYSRYSENEYVFCITSNAIKKERERSDEYCTKDAKKALASIKKTFSNKSLSERMNEAQDLAYRSISREWSAKAHEGRKKLDKLATTISDFTFVVMKEQFEAYARSVNMGTALDEHHTAALEMLTVDQINTKFSNNETTLILVVNGKYVVKSGDKIDMHDDNTLPVEMRGKLGMLKLVEPEQMIEGVGCRATTEVFVLMPTASELA